MAGESAKSFRTFACQNCGGEIQIKAEGYTLAVACRYCGSVSDPKSYQLLQKAVDAVSFKPQLPLGSRGKMQGHVYEVVGAMERAEDDWHWREYLLFNPYQGYRWLIENKGHWTFGVMIKRKPRIDGIHAKLMNVKYRKYSEGQARVVSVIGEFYWRVRVGERMRGIDYVAAPEMLSTEFSSDEQSWTMGTYIEADEVREAFAIPKDTLWKIPGITPPHKLSPFKKSMGDSWMAWCAFTLLLFVMQAFFHVFAPNQTVFAQKFTATKITAPLRSESFDLDGHMENIELFMESWVDQAWLGVDWELVNEATQQTIENSSAMSYYHGYDSDGSWSEGERVASAFFTDVPNGRYHLNMTPSYEPSSGQAMIDQEFRVKLIRGRSNISNFLIAWLLLSIPPIFLFFRHYSFESQKWSNSDYSPYGGNE